MLKAVFFDLGSTLIDNSYIRKNIDEEFNLPRLRNYGYRGNLEEFKIIKKRIELKEKNPGSREFYPMLCEALGIKLSKKELDKQYREFLEYVNKHQTLMPCAKEILVFIKSKGLKLAIISNLSKGLYFITAKRFDLKRYFNVILISEEIGYRKSELEPFRMALKKFKLRPEECLMIGDKLDEDAYAKKLGIWVCWIKSRPEYIPRKEIEKFDFEINSLLELKEIINKL